MINTSSNYKPRADGRTRRTSVGKTPGKMP